MGRGPTQPARQSRRDAAAAARHATRPQPAAAAPRPRGQARGPDAAVRRATASGRRGARAPPATSTRPATTAPSCPRRSPATSSTATSRPSCADCPRSSPPASPATSSPPAPLIDTDPETAYQHALAARARASRVAVVREATGETAYAAGHYAEALAELRAAKRMNGNTDYLPVMADCERALGRPERALELAKSPAVAKLTPGPTHRDDHRRGRRPPRPRRDHQRAAHPRERAPALGLPRGMGRPPPLRLRRPPRPRPAAPTTPSSGSTAPPPSTPTRSPTPPNASPTSSGTRSSRYAVLGRALVAWSCRRAPAQAGWCPAVSPR